MTRNCIAKVADEGNFHTTTLDVCPDGSHLATGSKMGMVNIFKLEGTLSGRPVKSVPNLTTSVTDLKFHPSSKLLALCSKWKKNAVRLVHLPSFTTYQNFPGAAVGILKYPMNLDFDRVTGRYLAMGNDEGKAHLWSLDSFGESA